MTYTDKELKEIVQLIQCGETLEEAKNIITLKYKLTDQGKKINELSEKVKEYFKIDTLVSPSRSSEDIAPMAVFTYLIHEMLGDYKAKNVHETFSIITDKSRCTFYHYTKMYEDGQHLVDRRICKKNYVANHFLILKGRILNEDVSNDLLIVTEKVKKDSLARKRFEQNKKDIIYDIHNNIMSYQELNRKYFLLNDHRSVKKFFALEEKKYIKFIRNSYRTRLSKIIETYKKGFKRKIEKGYTFEEINDYFNIYPCSKLLRKVAHKHERIIFDIIIQNENDRKKKIQTNQ
tara:strand:- start:108 stop:977 length:870 start_codon:yes stop_codon:yes gene_type:complete